MELYHIASKQRTFETLITIGDVQYYAHKLTPVQLLEAGYKTIVTDQYPMYVDWWELVEEVYEETQYNYIIKYKKVNKPLDELKPYLHSEIARIFKERIANLEDGVNVEGIGIVDGGERYIHNIDHLLFYLEKKGLEQVPFTTKDYSVVMCNKEQLENIKLAIIEAGLAIYNKRWELDKAVDAAKNVTTLKNIGWDVE